MRSDGRTRFAQQPYHARLRALFPRLLDEAHLRADAQAVERAFGDGVAVEIDLPSLRRFDEPVVPAGYEFRNAAAALGGVRLDLAARIALDVLDLPHRGVESLADRDQHMLLLGRVVVRLAHDHVVVLGHRDADVDLEPPALRWRVSGPLTTTRQLVMRELNCSRRRACFSISLRIDSDGS